MAYGMDSHQMYGAGDRVDAEVGYGLPVGARSFLDRVDDKTSTRAPSKEPQPLTVGVSRRCC